ncbi:hypothetical protein KP509_25G035900 [Ceratopteris richardii]|uniref:Uncharacterized protein n=1 Tax=Ceratopteris richardii TaxID=49495 RepID=A0A8T2RS80_CERRI|nr:hypothetical protein KP509_25G035900 [Ceratopteris richardii]
MKVAPFTFSMPVLFLIQVIVRSMDNLFAPLALTPRKHVTAIILLMGLLAIVSNGIRHAVGTIECEKLQVEECAFAVSSSGARCVLEKEVQNDAAPQFKCQTSIIMAERPMEWIESDECIQTCGLQRISVGLSTDALLERDFTRRLCFSQCRIKCPNINDLYSRLAAEEGVHLSSVCESLKPRTRRLGAVIKQDEKQQPVDILTAVTSQKTEVILENQVNAQNYEVQPPSATPMMTPSLAPSSGWSKGWPTAPSPYPVAEAPYPSISEPPAYGGGVEAEPPYYGDDYPPYDEWQPSPAAEEPASAPSPYYVAYESAPSPSPSLSPPSYYPSPEWV